MNVPVDPARLDCVMGDYGVRVAEAFSRAIEAEAQKELADLAKRIVVSVAARTADFARQSQATNVLSAAAASLSQGAAHAGQAIAVVNQRPGELEPAALLASTATSALGRLGATARQMVGLSDPTPLERLNHTGNERMSAIGRDGKPVFLDVAGALRSLGDGAAGNVDQILAGFAGRPGDLPGGERLRSGAQAFVTSSMAASEPRLVSAGLAAGRTPLFSPEGLAESTRAASLRRRGKSATDQFEEAIGLLQKIAELLGIKTDPYGAKAAACDGAGSDY